MHKELLEIQEVAKKLLSYLRKALDYSAQKGVLLAARAGVGRRELFLLPPSPESLHFGKKNCSVFSVFALVARNRTNEPTRRLRRQRYRCRSWIFRKTQFCFYNFKTNFRFIFITSRQGGYLGF